MISRSGLILVQALTLTLPATAQMTFKDIAADLGLVVPLAQPSPGMALGDYDGDGWIDFAVFGGKNPAPQILRNAGSRASQGLTDRWFTDVTETVFPSPTAPASAGQFADLDDDGDLDLLVVRRYFDPLEGQPDAFDTGLQYWKNENGRYIPATLDPFQARAPRRHGGLAVADTDVDGDLDVVFVHNGSMQTLYGGPGCYVRNDGLPRLFDITDQFGADLGGDNRYFTPILADFNQDMLPDLHVAVDFYIDFHCHNVGNGVFKYVTNQVGTTNTGADMGVAVGDIDNDGDLDMYSTNINIGVLYVNDGTGKFTDEAHPRGVKSWGNNTTVGWGSIFADLDLDMDLDLPFVAYGPGVGHLYENDGTGYFTDVTVGSGLNLRGHGLLPFDYDRDGDEDLLVMRTGNMDIALYENTAADAGDKHWLVVELEGDQSNSHGVGARIVATTADGTKQYRHIIAGYSYLTGTAMYAHFGLGPHETVDKLEVIWPDRHSDTYLDVPADQYRLVQE
jgi:hypothetical protein